MMMFLNILIVLSLLAVLVTLVLGFVNMARGGEGAGARSNVLMRYRVGIQFVAIILMVVGFMIKQSMAG
ncbi:twin transmembrane helix small protein [Hyphobacterium sp. HN65]|uniref:Twin transmembrane helix small protein n=1 Tax=Hyphobacterium lacteum TaxID=3116575 RepID=A0ABU7LQZ6_9PROT|nr:twin transmembrane helix small protein [Hyphobacterium sp. HN65]MEE2526014.1 twin transmembrane helix small protein [Hyphobacterium sp. HN65]